MRQQYFEGTAPPDDPQIPEVADAVDAWLAAKKKQVLASESTKVRHESMLELLADHGLERYPYFDDSGRKHYVVADKTPRAKTVKAPSRKQQGYDDNPPPTADDRVESRRVRRTAEHDRAADPFAATRAGLIEAAKKRQAETADVAADKPKKRGGKKGK